MKDRPILMCGQMVRQTLADIKTQTRRVIKNMPPKPGDGAYFDAYNGGPFWNWWTHNNKCALPQIKCPYGQPGDRLWVRESCYITPCADDGEPLCDPPIVYAADGASKSDAYPFSKPSIFMPRWASRITLEIVNVRGERVQDISQSDAKAEGCVLELTDGRTVADLPDADLWDYRLAFRELWDSINATRKKLYDDDGNVIGVADCIYDWASNPWVWVIEFRRVEVE